ncbi:MAG TPA: TIM-barrel domain-containing protein [Ohtaekwangia sp.]|nr:TIM-barrel domain-containing protein [Ohtaekwangia sp.]
MTRGPFLNLLCLLLILGGCSQTASYVQEADGIVIHFAPSADGKGPQIMRLQVIDDDIIRVVASPLDTLSNKKSLILDPALKPGGSWRLDEAENMVAVVTPSLRAEVLLTTGEITFLDSAGNVLLREKQGGGKQFTPITVDGMQAHGLRQSFESPDDEAFYGLGGHQNGQMNYKGQDVELVQHNIVDVVPFLYSNRNHGILWDNYSISKFGDPRDFESLASLSLFTRDGQPGGLSADYYEGDKIIRSTIEDKIDFEFLETPQVDNFPKEVARHGKVIWEGSFTSAVEGEHKFLVYASGYFKVWLDGQLIMDKWRQGWNPWTNKFTAAIKKGQRHHLKIEWTPDGGAYLAVKHLDPLPETEQKRLTLSSEVGDQIDYYFIRGNHADDVIRGYRQLTGKAPIVPKWAMGYWQSRERYRTQQEIVDVVKEYRKRKIPLDNIVLDWQYWEDPKWGSHEFDASRFPDPQGMIDELHNDLHAQLMISVWPKFNKGTQNYDEMKSKGFLFARNIEKQRKDWVGTGYESTFYDPFNKAAGELFWKQIDTKLNTLGIDAWWLDATEPDMHSNLSLEERKVNMSPTALGPGAKYFNAYSLMNSKSVYEGQRQSSPEKRVFILTRSAFAGQQRYGAVTWSGDIVSRWSDFQDQIATGINFSLSGIPYWTMDIGGFAVEKRYEHATGETLNEWRELNTRWFQFGAFCPIFRSHGQYPYREIFNIAPENHKGYSSMVYYDKMRYRLMPYLYSLAGKCYFDDYTLMRGLVMDFNVDPRVTDIADQYMFGPALLINPVYEYKCSMRKVYLPATTGWYDFYTGQYYEGGQTIPADAPLEKMPVFVKEGSIVPAGPEMQYSTEKSADPVTLYVFTGNDASFALYEDENVNYNYEKGQYATIPLSYEETSKTLTIGQRNGSFKNMPESRTFEVIWVEKDQPVGVGFAAHPDEIVQYSGSAIQVKMK